MERVGVAHIHNTEQYTLLCCLKLKPEGVGKPRETWRRKIEKEMAEVDKTWKELRWLTKDRSKWRKFVCVYASQEI